MLERLIALICEELGCDESGVGRGTLLSELVSDEIELQELVQALENEFETEFGEEINGDCSVSALAGMIEE
jgi:acyl carrier protein